jgi:hypothetical protein
MSWRPGTGTVPTARERRVFVLFGLGDDEPKASGKVELPLHVAWSEPRRSYDLDNRYDRRRVYEQVLTEGTPDDIRYYVRASDLIDLWDELMLPRHVREAWGDWMQLRRTA